MTIERLLEAGRALDAGQLELAARIYRQVAEADPRNSIAVVGLARVASARGAPQEALRLAEAALAIDPGNAAARRLVDEHHAAGDAGDPGAGPLGAGDPDEAIDWGTGDAAAGETWPWPDLDEQLARSRRPNPGRLARLLRRGQQ